MMTTIYRLGTALAATLAILAISHANHAGEATHTANTIWEVSYAQTVDFSQPAGQRYRQIF